jgi:hypothetical protein
MNAAEQPSTPPQPEPEEEYPESWIPWKEPGQTRTLVATVNGYSLGPDFGWGRKWICTVTDRDGKPWSVWLTQEVLVREFADEETGRPMPGESLTIRYMGKQDAPKRGGPAYHRFRVTVHRGPQLPPFLLGSGSRELESDIPADTAGLPPTVDVPDADVAEDTMPWDTAAQDDREGDKPPPDTAENEKPEADSEPPWLWDGPADWREPRTRGCGR